MVLPTENNYYTNIVLLVMLLLVAPISGLTVKISRFSYDPTISYINQHLLKNTIFKQNTGIIPHKIFIPHIPAFVYLVCFYSQSILQSFIFMALFFVQFSALHYFIFNVYTNLNFIRMFSGTFQIFLQIFNKRYYNLTFLQQFFDTCYLFLKKWSKSL